MELVALFIPYHPHHRWGCGSGRSSWALETKLCHLAGSLQGEGIGISQVDPAPFTTVSPFPISSSRSFKARCWRTATMSLRCHPKGTKGKRERQQHRANPSYKAQAPEDPKWSSTSARGSCVGLSPAEWRSISARGSCAESNQQSRAVWGGSVAQCDDRASKGFACPTPSLFSILGWGGENIKWCKLSLTYCLCIPNTTWPRHRNRTIPPLCGDHSRYYLQEVLGFFSLW